MIAQLDAARVGFPTYARRDVVLYLLGYAASLAGDADQARAAYQELTGLARSPLVAEAWLRLGERAFEDADRRPAGRDRRVHPRPARSTVRGDRDLQAGWSHWRQGDLAAAATMFQAALESAATNADAAVFATEARQYLALALIEQGSIRPMNAV